MLLASERFLGYFYDDSVAFAALPGPDERKAKLGCGSCFPFQVYDVPMYLLVTVFCVEGR